MKTSFVFCGTSLMEKGVVAVVFSGGDLHIEARTYLGWRPLSRAMRVTQTDGLVVKTIDAQPAFNVYKRYLNIANDEQFYLNALEFPLLLERNGELLARVPVAVNAEDALTFVADIHEGESVRIGYGDIDMIIEDSREIHRSAAQFSPQVIFLYTCGCRRFLMQENVELETLPFETLAPTFGFYTYGEFFGSSRLSLLNSTLVVVSLREGPPLVHSEPLVPLAQEVTPPPHDPYANKHVRIVSRLLRFIDAVTSELDASNQEVVKLSVTDRLTQLANRSRLEEVLEKQLQLAAERGNSFSVILIDLDQFKSVNDIYGHLAGDEVLVRIAKALSHHTRKTDIVGRWGGEEFLVIAPETSLDEAVLLAEALRIGFEGLEHPGVGPKTGSFGVAQYAAGDLPSTIIARADAALYRAKRGGRNRVEAG